MPKGNYNSKIIEQEHDYLSQSECGRGETLLGGQGPSQKVSDLGKGYSARRIELAHDYYLTLAKMYDHPTQDFDLNIPHQTISK